jgi:antitoxin FitA
MVALQIRDVPESARDALARQAKAKGQSLQSYLRELVLREASFTSNLRILEEISTWDRSGSDATLDDVISARDEARPSSDL